MVTRIRSALKRFLRAREGATAVEFGLLALPFFLLTFGLAEVALIGFAQTSLDYAVSETARQIRTGQAQNAAATADQIKAQLCTKLTNLIPMDCNNNLYLDVKAFQSYVSATNTNPVQNGNFDTAGFDFNPGGRNDVVVVRAFYKWQVLTPMFQTVFANVGTQRVLASSMMFRNEPF